MGKRYYYGLQLNDPGDPSWVVSDSWTRDRVAEFPFASEDDAEMLCYSLNHGHAAAVGNTEPVAGNDTSN